jgi:hypothetical protein
MSPIEDYLRELYPEDEFLWLLSMNVMAAERRHSALDLEHLAMYLCSMVRRDLREVRQSLTALIVTYLKWHGMPASRTASQHVTLLERRYQLKDLLEGPTLSKYAKDSLTTCHARAVELASAETGLPSESFPAATDFTLDALLSSRLPD